MDFCKSSFIHNGASRWTRSARILLWFEKMHRCSKTTQNFNIYGSRVHRNIILLIEMSWFKGRYKVMWRLRLTSCCSKEPLKKLGADNGVAFFFLELCRDILHNCFRFNFIKYISFTVSTYRKFWFNIS